MSLTDLPERNRRVARSPALDLAQEPDLVARGWEVLAHGLILGLKDGLLRDLGCALGGAGAPS